MKRIAFALCLFAVSLGAHAANVSGREVIIPVAGRLPGAFGTMWRTDLVVSNPSDHYPVTGEIIVHQDLTGDDRLPFTLPPRATVSYRDLFATLGRDFARGLIRVVSDERPVVARARIYNAGHPAGEFGQDVLGIPLGQLSQKTIITGLSSTDGNRANIGISNPHDRAVDVSVSWFDGDGEFHGAVLGVSIPARSVMAIDDIFDWTGQPRDVPLSIVVRSTLAANPVYLWGSVIRNDSGDAVFISGHDILD